MRRFFVCLSLTVACFAAADAQQGVNRGEITGRVVTEGGDGIPNLTVVLITAGSDGRPGSRPQSAVTGDDGTFKFAGLAPRAYSVNVMSRKGLVQQRSPASEIGNRGYYRTGDNVTIT
ncbi:MAG: carboxypeptidase-like regulatory domain-containing protein, partial [Blastocatellia bacterium]